MTEAATRGLAIFLVLSLVLARAGAQEGDADGAALFARYCASCHGRLGEGDGPVATAMASVPNLRTLRTRSRGTFPRQAVIRYIDGRDPPAAHGTRMMPVWGENFSAEAEGNSELGEAISRERIAAITDFVESLQN